MIVETRSFPDTEQLMPLENRCAANNGVVPTTRSIRKSTIADAARIVNPIRLVSYQKLEKSTGFELIPDESFDV